MAHVKFQGSENTPFGHAHFFTIEGQFEGWTFTGISWGITENNTVLSSETGKVIPVENDVQELVLRLVAESAKQKRLFEAPKKAIIKGCIDNAFWYADKIGLEVLVKEPYVNSWGFELLEGCEDNLGASIFRHDLEFITGE